MAVSSAPIINSFGCPSKISCGSQAYAQRFAWVISTAFFPGVSPAKTNRFFSPPGSAASPQADPQACQRFANSAPVIAQDHLRGVGGRGAPGDAAAGDARPGAAMIGALSRGRGSRAWPSIGRRRDQIWVEPSARRGRYPHPGQAEFSRSRSSGGQNLAGPITLRRKAPAAYLSHGLRIMRSATLVRDGSSQDLPVG